MYLDFFPQSHIFENTGMFIQTPDAFRNIPIYKYYGSIGCLVIFLNYEVITYFLALIR